MDDSNCKEELRRQIQDLHRLLDEEKRCADEAKKHADEASKRADEAKRRADEAKRHADEAKRHADEEKRKTRRITLDELIVAYHEFVFSKLTLENNMTLALKGPITKPGRKLCPKSLKPWPDFLQQQRITFGQLYETISPENRVFKNRSFLATLGEVSIRNERSLKFFLRENVEHPVRIIIDELKKSNRFRSTYDIGNDIVFEDEPNTMSDEAEEVLARQAASSSGPNWPQPSQMCVYRSDDEPARRTLLYVLEYKAPHKLTAAHLRTGLRSMNIYEEVIDRKTVPTSADPEGRFRYHAERLTAATLAQAYHHMIQGGLEFGLLTTGVAFVFLKIDWGDPDTLYYHLAEPESEAAAHPDNIQSCAALGQYLAFHLMTLGSPGQRQQHGQDERERAKMSLGTWDEDFESVLHSIPRDERQAPDDSSGYAPTTYSTFERSPIVVGNSNHRPKTDELTTVARMQYPSQPHNPNPTVRRSQRILAQQQQHIDNGQDRQYCTQKCLLGLVNGGLLDLGCPNAMSHRRANNTSTDYARLRHPFQHDEWLRLLSQQLAQSLDRGVTKLWMQGARGALFKVTMLAYGYTFVCKGTVPAFIPDLEREAAVYERLRPLQGIGIPVFLGAIDLQSINRTYYYDYRVDIIHMTFLSWGGQSLYKMQIEECEKKELETSLSRLLEAIHQEGVAHGDVRKPNVLHNSETGGLMLIDFERATLFDRPWQPLGELFPHNKKAINARTVAGKKRTVSADMARLGRQVYEDRSMAMGVFYQ
ncbi:hypothetical protein O1611_g6127 [Lasiodiplodia mahajangana]|uniref:Uncharacterized protein n=1 Tax=Lasiodiplodia mahajangana TaxID=1108764 RepID=A0ACC2JIZ7_9PEZI|nr:hypothetical protein O1611_g6127 [Lasiodiplodia mahajangana]